MFSCEFLEIFKNTFLDETPLVAASVSSLKSKSPLFSNIELSQLVYSSIERFLYDYISICRLPESILIMWIINLKQDLGGMKIQKSENSFDVFSRVFRERKYCFSVSYP